MTASSGREQAVIDLASHLGVAEILVFLADAELDVLLPGPGFPQTLPRGPEWPAFLRSCRQDSPFHGALVSPRTGGAVCAAGCSAADGSVLVLLGGEPDPDEVAVVCALVPLLAAAYRGEQAAVATAGHSAVAQDISRRAKALTDSLDSARRSLQGALRESQEADRRKDEFLAMLAHELRNPLAALAGAQSVLQQVALQQPATQHSPLIQRNLAVCVRQVHHLTRLVDDLLDVSRITRGKIELRLSAVELAPVVQHAIETSRPLLEEKGHRHTVEVTDEALWVQADAVRLVQVIGNLVNNAAKYTDRGGAIRVTVQREGEHAVVRVRDTGLGIPPELLPHVFDLFMQVHASIDRSQGGLGIGLTLVRKLMEMHGGTATASSAGRGQGSEFCIALPCILAPIAKEGGSAPPASPVSVGRRVLVVDDNEDAAQTLAELLALWGHAVRCAHDGESALKCAQAEPPDVILLDIGLPRIDGFEVARRLRAMPELAECMLIALTGYGRAEDRRRATEAGFDHHLVKPVEFEVLRGLLSSTVTPRR